MIKFEQEIKMYFLVLTEQRGQRKKNTNKNNKKQNGEY